MKRKPSKTLYEKRGRRFIPVGKDENLTFYPVGDYLLQVRKHGLTLRGRSKPLTVDHAKEEVVLADCEDAIAKAIMRASKIEPAAKVMTGKEQRAWAAFYKIIGKNCYTYPLKSARGMAEEAVICLRRLMNGPSECPDGCLEVYAERSQ